MYEKGIPLSEFEGWDEYSQSAVLVWKQELEARCSQCGTKEDDWIPEKGGSRTAYVPVKRVCEGCNRIESTIDQAHKDAAKSKKKTYGLKFFLMPQASYRTMMEKKRDDPNYREADRKARGVSAAAERKKEREEARERRRKANEEAKAAKGMHPDPAPPENEVE